MANTSEGPLERLVDLAIRLGRAGRALSRERRLAAYAASALFLTLFLPWYQQSVIAPGAKARNLQAATQTLTGWGTFSLAEILILIIAIGVLFLLFLRAEGRGFHLPGGDGATITAAGGLASLLIIWRMVDRQGTTSHGQYASTTGIEWGIIVALLVGVWLTYTGTKVRRAPASASSRSRRAAAGSPPDSVAAPSPPDAAPTSTPDAATTSLAPVAPPPPSEAAASPSHPEPAASPPPPEPVAAPDPEPATVAAQDREQTAATPERSHRSRWRPGERPEWAEPDRPTGWLTAKPKWKGEPEDSPRPPANGGVDQLTIPLEDE